MINKINNKNFLNIQLVKLLSKKSPHPNPPRPGREQTAFTLAEVLITLGVIGVVAALTLPTVIRNYQKQTTVNRLKQTYSILEQAVKMSEIDNGDILEWSFPENTVQSHIDWINKYLAPYMKNVTVEEFQLDQYPSAIIKLANGTIIRIWNGNKAEKQAVHAFVYFTDPNKSVKGKTEFAFFIGKTSGNRYLFNDKKGVKPYDYKGGYTDTNIRAILTNTPIFGCNKDNAKNKTLCTALIMHDGWQIKDDYPW